MTDFPVSIAKSHQNFENCFIILRDVFGILCTEHPREHIVAAELWVQELMCTEKILFFYFSKVSLKEISQAYRHMDEQIQTLRE